MGNKIIALGLVLSVITFGLCNPAVVGAQEAAVRYMLCTEEPTGQNTSGAKDTDNSIVVYHTAGGDLSTDTVSGAATSTGAQSGGWDGGQYMQFSLNTKASASSSDTVLSVRFTGANGVQQSTWQPAGVSEQQDVLEAITDATHVSFWLKTSATTNWANEPESIAQSRQFKPRIVTWYNDTNNTSKIYWTPYLLELPIDSQWHLYSVALEDFYLNGDSANNSLVEDLNGGTDKITGIDRFGIMGRASQLLGVTNEDIIANGSTSTNMKIGMDDVVFERTQPTVSGNGESDPFPVRTPKTTNSVSVDGGVISPEEALAYFQDTSATIKYSGQPIVDSTIYYSAMESVADIKSRFEVDVNSPVVLTDTVGVPQQQYKSGATFKIDMPQALPGDVKITVTAGDAVTKRVYTYTLLEAGGDTTEAVNAFNNAKTLEEIKQAMEQYGTILGIENYEPYVNVQNKDSVLNTMIGRNFSGAQELAAEFRSNALVAVFNEAEDSTVVGGYIESQESVLAIDTSVYDELPAAGKALIQKQLAAFSDYTDIESLRQRFKYLTDQYMYSAPRYNIATYFDSAVGASVASTPGNDYGFSYTQAGDTFSTGSAPGMVSSKATGEGVNGGDCRTIKFNTNSGTSATGKPVWNFNILSASPKTNWAADGKSESSVDEIAMALADTEYVSFYMRANKNFDSDSDDFTRTVNFRFEYKRTGDPGNQLCRSFVDYTVPTDGTWKYFRIPMSEFQTGDGTVEGSTLKSVIENAFQEGKTFTEFRFVVNSTYEKLMGSSTVITQPSYPLAQLWLDDLVFERAVGGNRPAPVNPKFVKPAAEDESYLTETEIYAINIGNKSFDFEGAGTSSNPLVLTGVSELDPAQVSYEFAQPAIMASGGTGDESVVRYRNGASGVITQPLGSSSQALLTVYNGQGEATEVYTLQLEKSGVMVEQITANSETVIPEQFQLIPGEYQFSISAGNYTEDSVEMTAICAVKTNSNQLEQIQVLPAKIVEVDETSRFDFAAVTIGDGCRVEFYLFQSIDGLTPLTKQERLK